MGSHHRELACAVLVGVHTWAAYPCRSSPLRMAQQSAIALRSTGAGRDVYQKCPSNTTYNLGSLV